MSTNTSTNTDPFLPVYTKLKDLIEQSRVSCRLEAVESRVLSQEAIDKIATLDHVRGYISESASDLKNLTAEIGEELAQKHRREDFSPSSLQMFTMACFCTGWSLARDIKTDRIVRCFSTWIQRSITKSFRP